MNKADLKQYKQQLETKRDDIEKQLKQFTVSDARAHEGHRSKFPDYGTHEDENVSEVQTYENRIALEQNLETTLKSIGSALKKIDDGTYGTCEKCKKPIQPERLKIYPEAQTCMSCGGN